LSVVWLISASSSFIPLASRARSTRNRYASEDFWRIPGGMPVVFVPGGRRRRGGDLRRRVLLVRGTVDTCMEPSLWMTWVGSIAGWACFVLGGIVYFLSAAARPRS